MRKVRVKRVELAFTEYVRTADIYIYIYEKSTVRLTSVGLAQARPNYSKSMCRSLITVQHT